MPWKPGSAVARDTAATYRRAATTCADVAGIVSDKDAKILQQASSILRALASGKDKEKAAAKRDEDRREKLKRYARVAAEKAFGEILRDIPGTLVLAIATDNIRPLSGNPRMGMARIVREASDPYIYPSGRVGGVTSIKVALNDLRRQVVDEIQYQIEKAVLNAPADPKAFSDVRAAEVEAARLKAEFESKQAAIVTEYRKEIDAVLARAVADRLEEASARR